MVPSAGVIAKVPSADASASSSVQTAPDELKTAASPLRGALARRGADARRSSGSYLRIASL